MLLCVGPYGSTLTRVMWSKAWPNVSSEASTSADKDVLEKKRVLTNIMTALKVLSDLLFWEAAKTSACALNQGTGDDAETSPGRPAYSSSLWRQAVGLYNAFSVCVKHGMKFVAEGWRVSVETNTISLLLASAVAMSERANWNTISRRSLRGDCAAVIAICRCTDGWGD